MDTKKIQPDKLMCLGQSLTKHKDGYEVSFQYINSGFGNFSYLTILSYGKRTINCWNMISLGGQMMSKSLLGLIQLLTVEHLTLTCLQASINTCLYFCTCSWRTSRTKKIRIISEIHTEIKHLILYRWWYLKLITYKKTFIWQYSKFNCFNMVKLVKG